MNSHNLSFFKQATFSGFLTLITITLLLGFPTANAQGTWKIESTVGDDVELRSVHMVNSSDGWAVGVKEIAGSPAIAFHYNGTAWNEWKDKDGYPPGVGKHSVFMVNSSDGWTGGFGGAMYHYNGSYWEYDSPHVGSTTRNSVFMVNSSEGWCVGYNGATIHYNGTGWFRYLPKPTNNSLYSVYMINSTEGWAVGFSGTILHYNGTYWNITSSPTSELLYSVFMVNSTEGWAVGDDGTILHYSGGTWNNYASPTGKRLRSVFMVNSTLGWAVGNDGVILKLSEGGAQVTELSTDCGVVVFEVDAGVLEHLTGVPEEVMPVEGKPFVDFICGLFSFNVTGLTPGQKVKITITFPNPVPTDAQFWKYGPTLADPVPHWYMVPFEDNDGDNVIIVEFQDGGVGDNNLIADGVIMEPSGLGIPYPPVSGELIPNSVSTIGTWIIAGISTIAITIGIAFKKRKLI